MTTQMEKSTKACLMARAFMKTGEYNRARHVLVGALHSSDTQDSKKIMLQMSYLDLCQGEYDLSYQAHHQLLYECDVKTPNVFLNFSAVLVSMQRFSEGLKVSWKGIQHVADLFEQNRTKEKFKGNKLAVTLAMLQYNYGLCQEHLGEKVGTLQAYRAAKATAQQYLNDEHPVSRATRRALVRLQHQQQREGGVHLPLISSTAAVAQGVGTEPKANEAVRGKPFHQDPNTTTKTDRHLKDSPTADSIVQAAAAELEKIPTPPPVYPGVAVVASDPPQIHKEAAIEDFAKIKAPAPPPPAIEHTPVAVSSVPPQRPKPQGSSDIKERMHAELHVKTDKLSLTSNKPIAFSVFSPLTPSTAKPLPPGTSFKIGAPTNQHENELQDRVFCSIARQSERRVPRRGRADGQHNKELGYPDPVVEGVRPRHFTKVISAGIRHLELKRNGVFPSVPKRKMSLDAERQREFRPQFAEHPNSLRQSDSLFGSIKEKVAPNAIMSAGTAGFSEYKDEFQKRGSLPGTFSSKTDTVETFGPSTPPFNSMNTTLNVTAPTVVEDDTMVVLSGDVPDVWTTLTEDKMAPLSCGPPVPPLPAPPAAAPVPPTTTVIEDPLIDLPHGEFNGNVSSSTKSQNNDNNSKFFQGQQPRRGQNEQKESKHWDNHTPALPPGGVGGSNSNSRNQENKGYEGHYEYTENNQDINGSGATTPQDSRKSTPMTPKIERRMHQVAAHSDQIKLSYLTHYEQVDRGYLLERETKEMLQLQTRQKKERIQLQHPQPLKQPHPPPPPPVVPQQPQTQYSRPPAVPPTGPSTSNPRHYADCIPSATTLPDKFRAPVQPSLTDYSPEKQQAPHRRHQYDSAPHPHPPPPAPTNNKTSEDLTATVEIEDSPAPVSAAIPKLGIPAPKSVMVDSTEHTQKASPKPKVADTARSTNKQHQQRGMSIGVLKALAGLEESGRQLIQAKENMQTDIIKTAYQDEWSSVVDSHFDTLKARLEVEESMERSSGDFTEAQSRQYIECQRIMQQQFAQLITTEHALRHVLLDQAQKEYHVLSDQGLLLLPTLAMVASERSARQLVEMDQITDMKLLSDKFINQWMQLVEYLESEARKYMVEKWEAMSNVMQSTISNILKHAQVRERQDLERKSKEAELMRLQAEHRERQLQAQIRREQEEKQRLEAAVRQEQERQELCQKQQQAEMMRLQAEEREKELQLRLQKEQEEKESLQEQLQAKRKEVEQQRVALEEQRRKEEEKLKQMTLEHEQQRQKQRRQKPQAGSERASSSSQQPPSSGGGDGETFYYV